MNMWQWRGGGDLLTRISLLKGKDREGSWRGGGEKTARTSELRTKRKQDERDAKRSSFVTNPAFTTSPLPYPRMLCCCRVIKHSEPQTWCEHIQLPEHIIMRDTSLFITTAEYVVFESDLLPEPVTNGKIFMMGGASLHRHVTFFFFLILLHPKSIFSLTNNLYLLQSLIVASNFTFTKDLQLFSASVISRKLPTATNIQYTFVPSENQHDW